MVKKKVKRRRADTGEEEEVEEEDEFDTRGAAEAKEREGATATTFKETRADKEMEAQSGTPGMASKQFQKLTDAEKNLYGKPLTAGGRPHPVAGADERQL